MPILPHGLPIPFVLPRVESLLDIGAGIRPQTMVSSPKHVCVEPHFEYVEALKEAGYEVIPETWRALEAMPDGCFDAVLALDIIEHLPKDEGFELIAEAERVASKFVLFFTPLGFVSQHCEGTDSWGLHGCEWQEHRSGWMPEDFPGYEFDYIDNDVTGQREAFFALTVKGKSCKSHTPQPTRCRTS